MPFGAGIINISYGLPRADGAIQKACELALTSGAILVAAYSNDSGTGFPAQLPNVIGVKRLPSGVLGDLQLEDRENMDVSAYGGPMHVGDKKRGFSFIGGTCLAAAM